MADSLALLERLIAFETVSRRPNKDLIAYLKDLLERAGIACTLVESADGANANLYAVTGPGTDGGVMLSGHSDVVPVEGQDWTVPAFRMTERDGKLYGRGTADMKGFVACAVRTMLLAADRALSKPLHLAVSYDEEIGCVGVRSLIDRLAEAPNRPDLCIVGEPTSLTVATGHKGKSALTALCKGRECHSALAPNGVNALHLAADFIAALRRIQAAEAEDGPRDEGYDIPYATLHAGVIRGGTAVNIVPNTCHVDFEIRSLDAAQGAALLARVQEAAAKISAGYPEDCGIALEPVNAYPGLAIDPSSEAVAFVKSLTGANSTTKVAFGTEGGLFNASLGVPTVVCGPGSMDQGHKPDEFIARDQLAACDAMLDALLKRLAA